MQREDHHEHEQEEIGPRPLALGVVQAEPQIQDLERADPAPEAHEQAEDERHRGQHLEQVDDRREEIEIRQHDVIHEVTEQRECRRLALARHPVMQAAV